MHSCFGVAGWRAKGEARAQATAKLVKGKDTAARQAAITDFRAKNPLTKAVLKGLKLPTYSAGGS